MACPNQNLPLLEPLTVWIISRVTDTNPPAVEYFRGPIDAWGPRWQSAWMFFDRAEAVRVRNALRVGYVLRVEELNGVLQIED